MRIDVLYQFNEKYAPFAGTSITSLLINNQHFTEINIYILGENLQEISKTRLEETVNKYDRKIIFIDAKEQLEQIRDMGLPAYRGSYAANLRLFLPYMVDNSVNQLLYLDADTAVVSKLDDIFCEQNGELPIYMVLDSLGMQHKYEIGLEEQDLYFNSGVILFNLSKWKELKLTEAIIDHIHNVRSNYPAPDQDLLNVVCRGKVGVLGPEYNFQPIHVVFSIADYCRIYTTEGYYSRGKLEQAKENPRIYHFFRFVGEFPWNQGNVHPDNSIFDYYLGLSPWKDFEKISAQLGFVFKIEKCLYRILPKTVFLRLFKLSHTLFIKKSNEMSNKNKINPNM